MSGWGKLSFRGKLFSLILLIMAANVVVLLCMGSTLFEGFYQSRKTDDLRDAARSIRQAYLEDQGVLYDEISQIENQNVLVSLFVRGEDGRLELTYHSRSAQMFPDREPPAWMDVPPQLKKEADRRFQQLLEHLEQADDTLQVRQVEDQDQRPELALATRLGEGAYLYLQTPREYIKSVADLAVQYTAFLSIAILLVGSVPIYFLLNRVTKPVREVQRVAQRVAQLDFSQQCQVRGEDEFAKLGHSVNEMSRSLEEAVGKLMAANEVLQSDLERQQQTNRMRQQFVANVSHDFKTPLALMVSYAEALLEQEPAGQRQEYCAIIINEGNRLSRMVGRLLCLSKLESGIDRVEESVFCLSEVVDQELKRQRILLERQGLAVQRELDDGLIVQADYQKIELVVQNLVENAVKYTPAGGQLRVRSFAQGERCRVEVENTGQPIAQEDLGSLFDSFYRADKARTASEGYGLGLAVVRAVLEAHGQDYGAENLPDGVRFWFTLELAQLEEPEEDCEIP